MHHLCLPVNYLLSSEACKRGKIPCQRAATSQEFGTLQAGVSSSAPCTSYCSNLPAGVGADGVPFAQKSSPASPRYRLE